MMSDPSITCAYVIGQVLYMRVICFQQACMLWGMSLGTSDVHLCGVAWSTVSCLCFCAFILVICMFWVQCASSLYCVFMAW